MKKRRLVLGLLWGAMVLSLASCGTSTSEETSASEVKKTISVESTTSPTLSPTPKMTETPQKTATSTPSPTPTPEPTEEVVETVNFTQNTFDQMSKGLGYLIRNVYVKRNPPYASGAAFIADDEEVYFDREHLPEDAVLWWMQQMVMGMHDPALWDENHRFPVQFAQNYMNSILGWYNEDPLNGTLPQSDGYYEVVGASGDPGWNMHYISQENNGENVTVTAQLIQDYVVDGEVDRGDFALTFQADENSMFGVHLVKVQRVREGETMDPSK